MLRPFTAFFSWLGSLPRAAAVIVAVAALAAVVLIVVIVIATLPPVDPKAPGLNGTTIVATATAAFGVIGAVVGAFFAVRSAGAAVDEQAGRRTKQRRAMQAENAELKRHLNS